MEHFIHTFKRHTALKLEASEHRNLNFHLNGKCGWMGQPLDSIQVATKLKVTILILQTGVFAKPEMWL